MRQIVLSAGLVVLVATSASAADVTGRVEMPDVCSPSVSPAVVTLERADGKVVPSLDAGNRGEVVLVDQRGLQFVPRVQAMSLGQPLRFANSDSETHSVHVVSPGFDFNQSMPAGQSREWVPEKAGVVRLVCDVHSHMRGYVVVGQTPWVRTCSREGKFRLEGVPDGRYILNVWHEMGDPLHREVDVRGGSDLALGTLTLTVPASAQAIGASAPVRNWPEVIDRITLTLASSLDAATRPGELKKARTLAEDAYWVEFEGSDMETAVRTHLGFARKGTLENQFSEVIADVAKVADGRETSAHMAELTKKLVLGLVEASKELNSKGVIDRTHLFGASPTTPVVVANHGDPREPLLAFKRAVARVRELAEQGQSDAAAAAMTPLYFGEFEPLESFVAARKPQDVRPLELRFYAIRGALAAGLKGEALTASFDGLITDVERALHRSEAQASGTFGPAFAASLITILREGAEVILLLAMLIALVAKTGQPGAMAAIRWGVGLAIVASVLTAWGLNHVVAATQGRAREIVEGVVMLTAAGVLFYVSYWLISKSESKRWTEFLKRQAKLGGWSTLALTAFLAVYREGAETALMYQAMIGAQNQSRAGLTGLLAGVVLGVVLLAAIALAIRATSVRVPLRSFFQVTGVVLFALAVVFAGNGIFELQASGLLKTTTLSGFSWLGEGIPALGLYPNIQTLSVQGLLLAGAAMALVVLLTGDGTARSTSHESKRITAPPAAGVGA